MTTRNLPETRRVVLACSILALLALVPAGVGRAQPSLVRGAILSGAAGSGPGGSGTYTLHGTVGGGAFGATTGFLAFGSVVRPTGISNEDDAIPVSERIAALYPHPVAGVATLEVTTAREGDVEVVLFDALGRLAARIAKGRFSPGRHVFTLGAGLAPGVYLLRMVGPDGAVVRPVAVLR